MSALADCAAEAGVTLTALSLAWTLQRPGITSIVLGPRTIDQLTGQLAALDGAALDDRNAQEAASSSPAGQALPAAALAAVVALAAVTAGLVRTHQASRASK